MILADLDALLLYTYTRSPDGVVFTIGGTPGADAAMELSSLGLLVNLGRPYWTKLRGDREWRITLEGRVAYARHEEARAALASLPDSVGCPPSPAHTGPVAVRGPHQ